MTPAEANEKFPQSKSALLAVVQPASLPAGGNPDAAASPPDAQPAKSCSRAGEGGNL